MAPAGAAVTDDAGRSALRDLRSAAGAEDDLDENGQRIRRRTRSRPNQPQNLGVTGVSGQPPRSAPATAASLLTGRGASLLQAPPSQQAAAAGPGFQVCVDEEFQPGSQGPASTAFPPRHQHMQTLPGFSAVRKENAAAAGIWTSARLKQDAATLPPAGTPKLDICTDDEFKEEEGEEEAAAAAVAAAAARTRLQQQQVMRGSGRVPPAAVVATVPRALASFVPIDAASSASAVLPPPVLAPAAPALKAAPPAAGSKTAARPASGSSGSAAVSTICGGYLESLLVGADGKEQCFEEARAAAWLANPRPLFQLPQLAEQQQEVVVEPAQEQQQGEEQQQVQQAVAPDEQPLPVEQPVECAQPAGEQSEPQAAVQQQEEEEEEDQEQQEDGPPTEDLAAALAGADERVVQQQQQQVVPSEAEQSDAPPLVKAQSVQQEAVQLSRAQAEPQAQVVQPEVVEDQQPEEQEQQPFECPAAEQQQQQQEEEAHVAAAQRDDDEDDEPLPRNVSSFSDPTVTINTRAALNAVNAVFNADLTTSAAPPPGIASGNTISFRSRRSMGPGGFGMPDPTVTMSTRAALNSINRMFSADLTGSMAPSPVVARGRPSMAVDPTMTFNTREAMNLVNGMFCDEGPAAGGGGGGDYTQVGGFMCGWSV